MQMENEYGSYNLDKRYMPYIKNVSAPSFSSVFTYFSHFADSWSKHPEQLSSQGTVRDAVFVSNGCRTFKCQSLTVRTL